MTDLDLNSAINAYLETLPQSERPAVSVELQRFSRWVGGHRPVRTLKPADVEAYAADLERAGDAGARRAQILKGFLAYLHRQKLTLHNLSSVIKVRRAPGRKAGGKAAEAPNGQRVVLTPEGYERLKAELAELEAARPRIAAEIRRAAADGDLSENAPYQYAREELARVQSRIREIQAILRVAEVQEAPTDGRTDRVALGHRVRLLDLDTGERLEVTLVGPGEADARAGRISIQSPLGRALQDARVNQEIVVESPAGPIRYWVEAIEY
jgi:transcription elongation factor GreA